MSTEVDLPESASRLYKETTGRGDKSGRYATAAWRVKLPELEPFLEAVGGLPEEVPLPWGGGSVTRVVPLLYPDSPRPMYADSVDYSFTGYDKDALTYGWVKVKVAFRTFQYDGDTSLPFMTEQYDGSTEYITQPGSAFKFPSDNRILNTEVGVQVPSLDFALTFHRMMPPLNYALYTALQGRVNSQIFVPGYYNLPAGTVLYCGPSGAAQTDVGGIKSFTITHRFRYRWIPHNQLMRPDGTGFEAPVRIGDTSNGILLTADLNQIFQY